MRFVDCYGCFSATAELILRNTKHLEMLEMTINNLDK
jgi:hypothetical protein